MTGRLQSITYTLFLFLTPLLVTSFSKELFEFPKTNFLYLMTGILVITLAFRPKFNFDFSGNKYKKIFLWSFLAVITANLLSFLGSADYYTSLFGYYTRFNGGLVSVLCIGVWFLFFANKNFKKDDVEKILLVIFVSGLIVSAYALLQKFGIDQGYWKTDSTKRVFSTFGQPNWLAAFLIPIFYLSLYFSKRLKIHTVLKVAPILIVYFAILFTYSISGIFAFLISIVIYGFLNIKEIKNYFRKYWPVLTVIFVVSLATAIPLRNRISEQVENMNGIIGLIETDNSQNLQPKYGDTGKIRLILWDGTINLIMSSPKQFLIGSGPETFVYVFPKFRPDSINATSEANFVHNKPHNWYLEIFANLGLIGLASYLSFIAAVIYVFINSEKDFLSKTLFCGWVSILASNFFGWPTVYLSLLFFVLPVLMNYRILGQPIKEAHDPFSFGKLFIFMLLGNSLILSAVILTMADYQFKEGQYAKAHTINPMEPRYELFTIISETDLSTERIRDFYYRNSGNPYVVKTLVNYLNAIPVSVDLKREIISDARKNSPSDRLFQD